MNKIWLTSCFILAIGMVLISIPYSYAAENSPPVAVDDTYLTYLNTPLVIDAPGVLSNDYDPDGDSMTAMFDDDDIANLELGTVVYNSDGSFTYTPFPDTWGTEWFTYRANDGTDTGNEVQVYITISSSEDPIQGAVTEIEEVIVIIEEDLVMDERHLNSLIVKLENAIQQLNSGQAQSAINQLESFINQVESNVQTGKMTQEEGDTIIAAVQEIIAELEQML